MQWDEPVCIDPRMPLTCESVWMVYAVGSAILRPFRRSLLCMPGSIGILGFIPTGRKPTVGDHDEINSKFSLRRSCAGIVVTVFDIVAVIFDWQ